MLIPICGERLPVKLECSVVKARGLPIMNKSINSTDGFVEVRFADNTEKTEVVTSLNPVWESDIFSFDTHEKELTTEFLEFRVMDYDTYSANDAIGRVHLDCNILVERMRWQEVRHLEEQFTMPIYDTINGLRGELVFQVSIHLLIPYDYTNYVQMLSGSQIPAAFILSETVGLLCDIKTVKDPDYEWLDRIRSPRSTNEARQSCIRETMRTAAISMANKADKYGCNLILGYHEHIDVEGSSSNYLTVRVYGTAIKITVPNAPPSLYEVPHIPLLSIGWVPHAKQVGFGSLISAKSIKILDEDEDSESQRKSWWTELRTELHQQAQSLGCDLVIGYTEHVAIHDGIMLLGCSGTAVLTGQSKPKFFLSGARGSSAESESGLSSQKKQKKQPVVQRPRGDTVVFKSDCKFFHTAMVEGKTSFPVKAQKCYVCKKGDVVDFIISTAPPPSNNCYQGPRNFIQVSVTKKINSDPEDTEEYAHELSNTLPFADNELFDCLLGEIKHVNPSANALFDTRFNYALSDDLLVCVITGIAVRLICIGKDDASSPLLSNVLMFSALQKTNDARRFSWGTVKEAMRFKQVNIPTVSLKILPIKSPNSETAEEANSSKGRLRLNTLVGRLKKRQHEKEYMSHVISERHLSISIGIIESSTGGNANNIAGIHVSPNISALLMNRETAETCPVIARWSDVFVKEDLSNSVRESQSLESFVLTTFEERLSQIRAIASLSGHSSVSHLRVDSPQFTISKEHAHIIIFMSCDIYSVDF